MSRKVNLIAGFIGIVLGVIAIVTFISAVVSGFYEKDTTSQKIQVYINDNDSVVNQLQMDLNHLTKLLEKMEKDSVVVTVSKAKRQGE